MQKSDTFKEKDQGMVLNFWQGYADYLRKKNTKWEEDGYYHFSIPKDIWDFTIIAPDVQRLLETVPELKKENQIQFYGMKIRPIDNA